MEIQKIKISEQERLLVSEFMGEEYPSEIDFNWLMPVVEKIESLGFQFHIGNEGAAIKKWWFRSNVPDLGSVQETKIAATWEICIRFIKWYNNQNPAK
jgi:hypothetical protein